MRQITTTGTAIKIAPTIAELQELSEILAARVLVRKAALLPGIDMKTEYQRGIALICDTKFKAALAPYMTQARSELPIPTNYFGRMGAEHHAKRIALRRLVRETGIDPVELPIPVSKRLQLIDDLAILS